MNKTFGILFTLTGFFAIAGALYTWGNGNLFAQSELAKVLIPFADLLLTGPLSIVIGLGIYKNKKWANLLGLNLSGIYAFGSLLVFISMCWDRNFSVLLMVPASAGFLIALFYTLLYLKKEI